VIPAFSELFEPAEQATSAFKSAIQQENARLRQAFAPQTSPKPLLHGKAQFIDQLLRACWQHFLADLPQPPTLIATGGYGRSELFPYSDIDILILSLQCYNDEAPQSVTRFCNFLWDIGLKPGLSIRSIDSCVHEAREDQTLFTSLLEMRLIIGDTELFEQLKQTLTNDTSLWPSGAYFQAKLHEQSQRYAKFHDTAYNLEPNIKESPGGLRDMQTIAWVFKRHYNAKLLGDLIKYDFLPQSEYDQLIGARDILWRVRFALHCITQRCEDRLLFDHQRELAIRFGYTDTRNQPDVEAFMQFFFKTIVAIERLNEMLLQLFNDRLLSDQAHLRPSTLSQDFCVIGGYLAVNHDEVFKDSPLALLEIFLLIQQSPSLKGIRADTIRLIRKHLYLIDDAFRNNKQANRIFIEILRQPTGITHQLKRMNRYGVLPAYLPDFANIVARMQYDLFHIYTVDEHTLFVIRNLRRFTLAQHSHELPFCNDVFLLTPKSEVLYIAALFHDIAKGKGGDHSELGEEIAHHFCVQHDLPAHDTKLITWLVRNHLLMSMTAQRKDISDPAVIHTFALQVGSIECLNYLYLLTVADIRATNPSLWNGWKDALLKSLYSATHKALHRGLHNPVARSERLHANKQEAHTSLLKLGICPDLIAHSWQHLSDDYFLRYSADEITWHTIAIAATEKPELPLVLLRPQTQRGSAEIFVYANNEQHIFSICTATLDQLGLTILDARIITTADQYVLNSFQILEQSGAPITDLFREIHICDSLRQALRDKTIRTNKNLHKQSRQARHFPIETRITFLDDPGSPYTSLEIVTTDRAGLLSTIGKTFNELELQLHDAKITTIGSRAEDMFYLSDRQGRQITNPEQRQYIQQTLAHLINSGLNA
jgi:[protein-PII] uridylyltransferase